MITTFLALLFAASIGASIGFWIAAALLVGKITDLENANEYLQSRREAETDRRNT